MGCCTHEKNWVYSCIYALYPFDIHLLFKDSLWIPSYDFLITHSLGFTSSKTVNSIRFHEFFLDHHPQNVEEEFYLLHIFCNPIDVCIGDVGLLGLLGCYPTQEQKEWVFKTRIMHQFYHPCSFVFYVDLCGILFSFRHKNLDLIWVALQNFSLFLSQQKNKYIPIFTILNMVECGNCGKPSCKSIYPCKKGRSCKNCHCVIKNPDWSGKHKHLWSCFKACWMLYICPVTSICTWTRSENLTTKIVAKVHGNRNKYWFYIEINRVIPCLE